MVVNVEPIGQPTLLGEAPFWDDKQQVLYFVDVPGGTVNKYNPATKVQTSVKVGTDKLHASLVIPVEGRRDQFLVTIGRDVSVLTWDGVSGVPTKLETLCSVHQAEAEQEYKFNDGKVDPTGRFWAGTLGQFTPTMEMKTKGSLFSFSKDWKPTTRLTDISLSNGMAWSNDQKTMYYIDSKRHSVFAFDFNPQTGDLDNQRVLFDSKKNNLSGDPDGMTIDTEGKLWVAFFGDGQVIQVDPTSGNVLRSVTIPSPQTTSVAFGGPNLDELYVTSANRNQSEENRKKYPYAGYTFRVTGLGAKGFPGKTVQLV